MTSLRRASSIVAVAALCLSGSAFAAIPGGLDTTFGEGGLVVEDMGGADDAGRGVVVDADGSITVVGEARQDDQHLRTFALVRYTADGTLDPGFGDRGMAYTEFGEFQGSGAYAAALQPDGGLVVAGFGRHPEKFHDTFAVARYLPDGSLDPSFGQEGRVLTAVEPQTGAGPADIAHAVAIDPDGRILVAGETGALFKDIAIVRYLPDGQLDPAFGTDGIVVTDLGGDDRANALAVFTDGSILVAGSGWQLDGELGAVAEEFAVVRYNADGSLDEAFGTGGVATTDFRGGSDRAYGVAARPDGSIVVGGTVQLGGGCSPSACERYGLGVAQLSADGVLDTAFGTDGLVAPDFLTSSGAYAMALKVDGTTVLAGHIGSEDFGLMFVDPTGAIVPVEGGDAVRIDIGGSSDHAFGVALAPDEAVVAAGDTLNADGGMDVATVRYLPPGE